MDSLPLFTRHWFRLTIAVSVLGFFGILNPQYLILDSSLFFKSLHVWRPITAMFLYPINDITTACRFLLNLYLLYSYSSRLEAENFRFNPGDHCFMLLYNWAWCIGAGLILGLNCLMDSMVLSVLYVWCQLSRDEIVNFLFDIHFEARYFPWVLLGLNLITGGGRMGLVTGLVGIKVGSLYVRLAIEYPEDYGRTRYFSTEFTSPRTPKFLYRYFPTDRINFEGRVIQAFANE